MSEILTDCLGEFIFIFVVVSDNHFKVLDTILHETNEHINDNKLYIVPRRRQYITQLLRPDYIQSNQIINYEIYLDDKRTIDNNNR